MNYREIAPNELYHVYSRGTNKMVIYRSVNDYMRFIRKFCEYKEKYSVQVYAYCLMPNHFHLLLGEPEVQMSNTSYLMKNLLISYSKYYCLKYEHSGNVFQGRFKSIRVAKDSYFLSLVKYIHDNPVRKKLVLEADEWMYSSASKYSLIQLTKLGATS